MGWAILFHRRERLGLGKGSREEPAMGASNRYLRKINLRPTTPSGELYRPLWHGHLGRETRAGCPCHV